MTQDGGGAPPLNPKTREALTTTALQRIDQLRAGKKPEEIGWIARQAIESQRFLDPKKLDTRLFQSDRNATHYYGEMWRARATQLLSELDGAAD